MSIALWLISREVLKGASITHTTRRHRSRFLHLSKVDDLFLLRYRVDLDDAERRSNAQCAIQNVHTENNGVTLRERSNGLEPAWPDSLRCRIPPLRLRNFLVVRRKGVEEVVNDVR